MSPSPEYAVFVNVVNWISPNFLAFQQQQTNNNVDDKHSNVAYNVKWYEKMVEPSPTTARRVCVYVNEWWIVQLQSAFVRNIFLFVSFCDHFYVICFFVYSPFGVCYDPSQKRKEKSVIFFISFMRHTIMYVCVGCEESKSKSTGGQTDRKIFDFIPLAVVYGLVSVVCFIALSLDTIYILILWPKKPQSMKWPGSNGVAVAAAENISFCFSQQMFGFSWFTATRYSYHCMNGSTATHRFVFA